MKQALIPALLAATLAFLGAPLLSQTQDLSGTWVGETVVPNMIDKDQVMLVLKREAGSYSGTITDTMGMANAAPLEDVKFENDTLSAQFMVSNGGEYIRIWMTLKVTGDKLIGEWQDGGDGSGPLELIRK